MHTRLCRHATGDAIDLAAEAVRRGLTEIGFSEHNPMSRDDWDDWHMYQADLAEYFEQIERARSAFPQLTIQVGLEVDFIPGQEPWIRELAERHPWDYLIGAVHYVSDTWALDNPHLISEWKKRDPFEIWTTYFGLLTQAADSGLFDIIAHADLCKKFCFRPEADCTPLYARLLETMARRGLALELNTAGLRKDCREIYPAPEIVRLAAALKIPITFGSDAHAPGEVGADFAQALALARSCGYTESRRFKARTATSVKF